MALKLEELINKKKEPNQILDLSRIRIRNKEEFEKYLDKVPEYKIRPEKVRTEDIRVRDTEYSFKLTKKETKYNNKHEFPYGDPCPTSMKTVRLEDLAAVDISWRMLTMLRPNNRLEEDIFSRLVELGKLRLATRNLEAKHLAAAASGAPGTQSNALMASMGIIVSKSKRGGVETRMISCKECGLELCNGAWCKEFPYESYTRMILDKDELENDEDDGAGSKGKKAESRRASKIKGTKGKNSSTTGGGAGGKKKGPPTMFKTKKKIGATGPLMGGTSSSKPGGLRVLKKKRKKRKASPKKKKKGITSESNSSSEDE